MDGKQKAEPKLQEVVLRLCDYCLDGAGGECHTPGCDLWINRAPDIPIRDRASVICPGCRNVVSLEMCACGVDRKDHDDFEVGHVFVPAGCDCMRPKPQEGPDLTKNDPEAWRLLHALWDKAVGTDSYVKKEWQELERIVGVYLRNLGEARK